MKTRFSFFYPFFSVLILFFVAYNADNARAAMCFATPNCVEWSGTERDCTNAGGTYWPGDVCGNWCFCSDNVADIEESNYTTAETNFISTCVAAPVCNENSVKRIGPGGTKYSKCRLFGSDAASKTVCDAAKTQWDDLKAEAIKKFGGYVSGQQGLLSKIIPNCALQNDLGPESPCRDVTIFVAMGINVASYLFSFIGALALLMFVYGGFTLVLSSGNPEKVKKGGEIIFAAILGLIIVFGAYVLVRFLGEAIGVNSNLL